jgi:endonuclease YncB( thermonuclease family)
MQRIAQFWKSGARCTLVVGCSGLLVTLCLCGLLMLFLPKESVQQTSGEPTTTRVVAETEPTDTPKPTETPLPIDTPSPTDTPQPTDTPTPAFERVEAQVVKVVDGDTIKVEIDGTVYPVRYIGIDCPETVHPSEPVQWMGPEACNCNRRLVEGKTVYLEKDVSETDQYGRLLCYVFLADGTFVNAELIRQGYAQSVTYPPDVRYQDLFLEAQQEAREAERGLWGPTPTPLPRPTATPIPPTTTQVPATESPQPTPVPTQPPAPTVAPTEAPPAQGDVRISYIYYDGQVARVESDEYAVIKNMGGSPVNVGGWRLNAGNPGQDFVFPSFELQPEQECRVYTNEYHPETCGFSFGCGQALWRNSGDCGYLYDASGAEVATYCY